MEQHWSPGEPRALLRAGMTGSQGHGLREGGGSGEQGRGGREGVQGSSAVADYRRPRLWCSAVTVLTARQQEWASLLVACRQHPLGVGAACPAGLLWPGHPVASVTPL